MAPLPQSPEVQFCIILSSLQDKMLNIELSPQNRYFHPLYHNLTKEQDSPLLYPKFIANLYINIFTRSKLHAKIKVKQRCPTCQR